MRDPDGVAAGLDDQQLVEAATTVKTDPQRVGNFELYDFPKDSVAPAMNALRARDLMAYQTRVDEKNGNFSLNEAEVANSLSALWPSDTSHRSMTLVQAYRKSARVSSATSPESWVDDGLANTLNNFDVGDIRTTHAVIGTAIDEDDLLPVGLDSHRYRCCGNGVVAPVAEWIGRRIVEVDRRWREEGK